jgi:hypothetical protein
MAKIVLFKAAARIGKRWGICNRWPQAGQARFWPAMCNGESIDFWQRGQV